MKIYLIGLPGSGKTTLGKQLARALHLPFIDLDKEIETHEGKSVSVIFSDQGEAHFRLVESQLLHRWAESQDAFVMATGGGAPCYHDGITVINNAGLSVFLDPPLETIVSRIEHATNRPLLATYDITMKKDRLLKLYAERVTCYEQAKLRFKELEISKLIELIQTQ